MRRTDKFRPPKGPGCRSEAGFSLIVVLWVLALLMMIVAEFAYTVRVESAGARNFGERSEAYYLAVAGIETAISKLPGEYSVVHIDGKGNLVFRSGDKDTQHDAEVVEPVKEFSLGEGKVRYEIEDERSKLNINMARPEMLDAILKATGVDETDRDVIMDSIEDWKDQNQEHHLNGAEDDYYGSLPKPYGSKDGAFHTVEELLLVKGMSPAVLYGKEGSPAEFGTVDESYGGVRKFLTADGDGSINLNTAPEIVLEALYGKGRAIEIMLKKSMGGYLDKPAFGAGVRSDTFSIISTGTVRGREVRIRALVKHVPGTSIYKTTYWNEGGVLGY